MTNDIVFGTDILDDGRLLKLKDIHCAVKSRKLVNDDYVHYGHLSCQVSDIGIIDFFTDIESNRRLSTTGLLCAGLINIYSWSDALPVSMSDMLQIISKVTTIDELGWIINDVVELYTSSSYFRRENSTLANIYIPKKLWSEINRICMVLGISIVSFILYLIRVGVKEYNAFTEQSIEIDWDYLDVSERAEKEFKPAFMFRYTNTCRKIEYVYKNCKDVYLAEPRRKKSWDKIEKAVVSLIEAGFL